MIQDDTTYLRFLNEQIGKSSQRKYESLIRSFSVSLKDIPFKDVNIQHIEYLVKYTRRKRVENFTSYKNYMDKFKTENFVLIDTGWNGTTESILSTLFNEYNFSRLNLGVIKRSAGVPALGIIFDNYNENDEFWFLKYCRHLFEVILEPKLESQIGLEFKNNRYVPKYEDKSQKFQTN